MLEELTTNATITDVKIDSATCYRVIEFQDRTEIWLWGRRYADPRVKTKELIHKKTFNIQEFHGLGPRSMKPYNIAKLYHNSIRANKRKY